STRKRRRPPHPRLSFASPNSQRIHAASPSVRSASTTITSTTHQSTSRKPPSSLNFKLPPPSVSPSSFTAEPPNLQHRRRRQNSALPTPGKTCSRSSPSTGDPIPF